MTVNEALEMLEMIKDDGSDVVPYEEVKHIIRMIDSRKNISFRFSENISPSAESLKYIY